MTRDEAVAIAKKSKDDWGGGSSELWLVNALVALGMLKLDEPKSPITEFIDAMRNEGIYLTDLSVRRALGAAGLKIALA